MCTGGSSEISRASFGLDEHHERPGGRQSVIGAGDSDVGAGAGRAQLVAIGEVRSEPAGDP